MMRRVVMFGAMMMMSLVVGAAAWLGSTTTLPADASSSSSSLSQSEINSTTEEETEVVLDDDDDAGYVATGHGVDWTFPMHHLSPVGSPGRAAYDEFMSGCAPQRQCEATERQRMEMNREQAKRQRNYTELGFGKLKAPEAAYVPAKAFFDKFQAQATTEQWPAGNTYTNSWAAPSKMVSFEDQRFQPYGLRAKQAIWDGLKPTLEAWTGMTLKPTSLYGVRLYTEGAILNPHLDRLPLVTSAIMQVDQDVDAPWPIEVIGHDGNAYNVTLNPGEIALYESHTVIHGRPYPMHGRFFANLFVHFVPLDPSNFEANDPGVDFDWLAEARRNTVRPFSYTKPPAADVSLARARAAAETSRWTGSLPAPNAPAPAPHDSSLRTAAFQDRANRRTNAAAALLATRPAPPSGLATRRPPQDDDLREKDGVEEGEPRQHPRAEDDVVVFGETTEAHYAAATGDVPALLDHVKTHPTVVNAADENLWTPLHEAARSGFVAAARALVDAGADLGARTLGGATALFIAKQNQKFEVASYLESLGAPDQADEEL